MDSIKLGDLYLSKKESKYIIELLAKKGNIKNYKSKSRDKLYNIFKKQSKNKKNSPKWLKDKKSIINPKSNDSKCFQYAVTLALNLDKIKKKHKEYLKLNLL